MELNQAIELLKKAVKHTGTINQKHIDLTIIPAQERSFYEKALVVVEMNIRDGVLTKDEFLRRIHLND